MRLVARLLPSALPLESQWGAHRLVEKIAREGEYDLVMQVLRVHPMESLSVSVLGGAARAGSLPLVKYLIDSGLCDYGKSLYDRISERWAYDCAARGGHMHIMRYLDTLPNGDGTPRTPEALPTLLHAVKKGHLDIVKMLVEERRHPINQRRTERYWAADLSKPPKSALEFAVMKGHSHIARYFRFISSLPPTPLPPPTPLLPPPPLSSLLSLLPLPLCNNKRS